MHFFCRSVWPPQQVASTSISVLGQIGVWKIIVLGFVGFPGFPVFLAIGMFIWVLGCLQACRAVLRQQRWTCQSDLPDEWWETIRADTWMLFCFWNSFVFWRLGLSSSSDNGWAIFYKHRVMSLSLSLFTNSCHDEAGSGLVWPCLSPSWFLS